MSFETKDQRSQNADLKKEVDSLQNELESQKEANVTSVSNTLKNMVESLKLQLVQKEKQIKVLILVFNMLITKAVSNAFSFRPHRNYGFPQWADLGNKRIEPTAVWFAFVKITYHRK